MGRNTQGHCWFLVCRELSLQNKPQYPNAIFGGSRYKKEARGGIPSYKENSQTSKLKLFCLSVKKYRQN